jgi:hypothetical protein
VSSRIFGEVVKDVDELHRAAEFCCNLLARRRLLAEDAHRKPADSHCYALAIAVERREARRPNIGPCVRFHAVDDGEEIVTSKTIETYGFLQTTGLTVLRLSSKGMSDFHCASSIGGFPSTSAMPRRPPCP